MYRTIMVPLDGSSFSEHALPLALSTARLSNATLHLVRVHDTDQHRSDMPTRDPPHERDYLAGIAAQLAASWPGAIETALLDGPATESIAAYAESHHSDLVVMTTHGRGAFARAWLGSIADRLIRRLPMPMVLVRPHETDPAEIANPPKLNHILIPLDESKQSEGIITHAISLGRLTGATYSLLETVELVTPDYGFATYALSDAEIGSWVQAARQYLDRIATGLRAEGLQVATDVLIGPPATTILNYAHDHAVDLIAIETHGRNSAARLFLGSVADKIVRGAGVPLLLQRPQARAASKSLTLQESSAD